MIHPHQPEDRRVKIIYADFVHNRFVPDVVGLALVCAAAHAAAGHPCRERVRIVITTRLRAFLA